MVNRCVKQGAVFILVVCIFFSTHVRAEDRDLLGIGAGVLGIADGDKVSFTSIEYRSATEFYKVSPWVGLEFSDQFFYGAVGLLIDFLLTEEFRLTPSLGVGYYPENGDVDLGGDLQFRSAIELSYKFRNSGRLAISCSHISNSGIYDENPGTEVIRMTYYIPLGYR